jgi:hypothetical protein
VIEVLLIAAAMYWVAAPDPVTAGARTAAGTGARAAGAGARSHWASGRGQRQARRTKRRDGWWKAGGWRRAALKAEHAGVWSWGAGKTAAGVTAAAVRPVPAAVKAGWGKGRDRHRAKAGNRPAPVALDLPWWHREHDSLDDQPHTCSRCGRTGAEDEVFGGYYAVGDIRLCDSCVQWLDRRYPEGWPDDPAEVTEFGQGQRWPTTTINPPIDPRTGRPVQPAEQVPVQGGNSPENSSGTGPEQPTGTGTEDAPDDWRVIVTKGRRGYEGHVLLLGQTPDLPEQYIAVIKGRTPEKVREDAAWLIGEEQRESGKGRPHQIEWIDQNADPADPPAGTSPDGTTTTTEGEPVSANVPTVELNDLDSVRRFTEYVATLPEDSEFMQIVEQCKVIRENFRAGGFGGDMDSAGAAFEESAAALATAVTEFAEQSTQYAGLASNVAGG